jgi:hypothetical protein
MVNVARVWEMINAYKFLVWKRPRLRRALGDDIKMVLKYCGKVESGFI